MGQNTNSARICRETKFPYWENAGISKPMTGHVTISERH